MLREIATPALWRFAGRGVAVKLHNRIDPPSQLPTASTPSGSRAPYIRCALFLNKMHVVRAVGDYLISMSELFPPIVRHKPRRADRPQERCNRPPLACAARARRCLRHLPRLARRRGVERRWKEAP